MDVGILRTPMRMHDDRGFSHSAGGIMQSHDPWCYWLKVLSRSIVISPDDLLRRGLPLFVQSMPSTPGSCLAYMGYGAPRLQTRNLNTGT